MKRPKPRLWVSWLLVGLGLGPLAVAQESNSAPNDRVTGAVVQLLAFGPTENEKNRECGGTGFFVNAEGYIVTNAHVFHETERCLERGMGTKIMARLSIPVASPAKAVSCDLIGLDEVHDLAVIKTERPPVADLPGEEGAFLGLEASEIIEGAILMVTGHPLFAWEPITQSGKVIRRGSLRLSESSREASDVLVLNIPLRPGSSGSPVYLAAGTGVVGIVESQDRLQPSNTIAVPVHYAVELLNRYGVRWHAAEGGGGPSWPSRLRTPQSGAGAP